jgi:hypothetical protein
MERVRDHQRTQTAVRRPRSMNRASTSPCTPPTAGARPDTSPARDHRSCAGRCMRLPRPRPAPAPPTTRTTAKPPSDSGTTAPASRSLTTSSSAATTPSKTSATRRSRPHERGALVRAPRPTSADAPRPAPRTLLPATSAWTASKDRAAAPQLPPAGKPHQHHVADLGSQSGSCEGPLRHRRSSSAFSGQPARRRGRLARTRRPIDVEGDREVGEAPRCKESADSDR